MTEVNLSYDFIPGFDQQAYKEWAKKAIGTVLQTPGLVEFRAFRNVLGSPYVRTTTVWQSLTDWVKFFESPEWQEIETELRDAFATNVSVEIWGPSPVAPTPLRPGN